MNPVDKYEYNMFGDGEGLISALKKDIKAKRDKMSILEKLGITPGPWEDNGGGDSIYGKGVYVAKENIPEELKGISGNDYLLICEMKSQKFDYDTRKWITKNPGDRKVILAASEMLEALIEFKRDMYGHGIDADQDTVDLLEKHLVKMTIAIEKATDKSWTETESLIDNP